MYTTLSWSVEAGIVSKLISETKVVMREAGFKGNYWVQPRNLGIQELHPVHILPAIILCVSGLVTATMVYISEMIYHKCRVKDQTTRVEGNDRPTVRNEDPKAMDDMPPIQVE